MDLAGIREALNREPFEVFSFRLADGRRVPVVHPDFVALGTRRVVVVAPDDSWKVIEPLLIVSIHYNGAKPKSKRHKPKR